MAVLRIKLTQTQAHYGRPECVDNRMSYPLPPFSTIIGAIHNACSFEEYVEMDISVQGKYDSMQKEVFTYQALNNRREDDRGNLVYLQNPDMLGAGYILVAKAIKNQGNSFKNNVTIDIVDKNKMQEYWDLLKKSEELDEENALLKERKGAYKSKEKELKAKQKNLDKKSEEYTKIKAQIDFLKAEFEALENAFKQKKKMEYEDPISHYKTLIKGPRYVEVLYGVELVIHIRAAQEVLEEIIRCKHNFVSLGRSEDFVEITEMMLVELSDQEEGEYYSNGYGSYVRRELFEKGAVFIEPGRDKVESIPVQGTTYYLPKKYEIIDHKRVFEYYPVCYTSHYYVDSESFFTEAMATDLFIDHDEGRDWIVNFV